MIKIFKTYIEKEIDTMEITLKVVVLSHTPEFEQNIVRGAKLCYSSADIETLRDKVTPEEAEKFLDMIMGLGHGSVLEHSSITFGIEGVSRSLTHQLVRHRLASYSQKSQRYVKEGQFTYVVPKPIQDNPNARCSYIDHMERTQKVYDSIVEELLWDMIAEYLTGQDGEGDFNKGVAIKQKELNSMLSMSELIQVFKECEKRAYSRFEKIAIENARYILPNACETKIQMTVNVRTLFNFFKERLCDRAQDEIRDLAWAMWLACMEISHTIFKHATPSCVHGKCKEGAMSCGKMLYYKDKHSKVINSYLGGAA